MASSKAFPLPNYGDDDLAAAGAKLLSRSVQRMSAKIIKSAVKPLGGSQKSKPKSTKSVHFEAHLESVCYFMKDDEPCLIAARISTVKRTLGDCNPLKALNKESPLLLHDSTCVLDMISQTTNQKNDMPVRVEQVYVSNQKNLMGTLAVANISFAERVKVKFTLDNWKTVSETAAEYFGNHRRKGFDTFGFTIPLNDTNDGLMDKTMSFCVCYMAEGREITDNNDSMDYKVELSKLASQISAMGSTDSTKSTPSFPAVLKTGFSPHGILRPSSSHSKLNKFSTASSGHSLFGSLSRSKSDLENLEKKQTQAANTHANAPLWKYMDRLSSNATTLSSRQLKLLY